MLFRIKMKGGNQLGYYTISYDYASGVIVGA
jgi:hypothetical protein